MQHVNSSHIIDFPITIEGYPVIQVPTHVSSYTVRQKVCNRQKCEVRIHSFVETYKFNDITEPTVLLLEQEEEIYLTGNFGWIEIVTVKSYNPETRELWLETPNLV
jgi:hypothetical protein